MKPDELEVRLQLAAQLRSDTSALCSPTALQEEFRRRVAAVEISIADGPSRWQYWLRIAALLLVVALTVWGGYRQRETSTAAPKTVCSGDWRRLGVIGDINWYLFNDEGN